MVEPTPIGDNNLMHIPSSSDSVFAFGSCKEGWYYRCLGLDPVKEDVDVQQAEEEEERDGYY